MYYDNKNKIMDIIFVGQASLPDRISRPFCDKQNRFLSEFGEE